jgi:FkbM family methyltransferase
MENIMEQFGPYSSWDELIKNKIQHFNKNWKIFCDVGACQGEYTTFFKEQVYESISEGTIAPNCGKVYSFEPNRNNYNYLLQFQDENCIIENIAVSDSIEKVNFYSEEDTPGEYMGTMLKRFDIEYPFKYEVKTTTLDDYFKNIDVDCIKIDVEGAENLVIRGGINTIKKSNFCIIECHWDEDWVEIFTLLTSNGMIFKDITNDQDITIEKRPYQIYKIIK